MKTWISSLILLATFCCSVFAQPPKAAIKGPTEVLAGTLLFLSNEDAVGNNKVWLIDDELKSQSASCGANIFFAIPKPGKYTFGLIVANKEAQIDYVFHTVLVKSSPGTPPSTDPSLPPPPIPPPASYAEVTRTSKLGADSLDDPPTRAALTQALTNTLLNLQPSLQEAKGQVSTTIETVLLFRNPVSRTKDWLNKWRKPVQNSIEKQAPTTIEEYKRVLQAIIDGLKT